MQVIKVNQKDEIEYLKKLKSRNEAVNEKITAQVKKIIKDVETNQDQAVEKYTEKFDGKQLERFEVSQEEIATALKTANPKFIVAMKKAIQNITNFHQRQKQQGFITTENNGAILGQQVRGLDKVGIYVPSGTAPYPSSVLMNAIPAKIAGVNEIIMVTPPNENGKANTDILAAAALCEVDRVFAIGGAQAIAALAYGTETIPKVDKIVGPGNIYVATAKQLLYGVVDIDMIAGPSEILILADESANPEYVAADLMSQAEHDILASSILVTTSTSLAKEVVAAIGRQIKNLSRAEIIKQSFANYGAIFTCDTMDEAIEMANFFAPEHLEVMVDEPMAYLGKLNNAGSIFLGHYTPEPLGDYFAGPNHVLPTSGTARFFSPLSVDSFIKKTSFIYYTKEALEKASQNVIVMANIEGLTAHANSVVVRTKEEKNVST